MKKIFIILSLVCSGLLHAQEVTEVKGLRLYEHHSSDMTSMPFGNGADGSKSGYDFVNRRYFKSFNEANMGAYSNGEEQNIDMVEHEGMFGTSGMSKILGFTAGVSSIWSGQIKGNEQTKWHLVTNGLAAYDATSTKAALIALYNPAKAQFAVTEVKDNEVYVGRIRGSNLYVLVKCTGSKQPFSAPDGSTMDNSYFNFDYKYTGSAPTGIAEATNNISITVFPNPASEKLVIRSVSDNFSGAFVRIVDALGKEVYNASVAGNNVEVNTSALKQGLYYVVLTNSEGMHQLTRSVHIIH
ncbi:MAG: T9SS type A sorting domain-containing protein [Bacteroidota bacterium]